MVVKVVLTYMKPIMIVSNIYINLIFTSVLLINFTCFWLLFLYQSLQNFPLMPDWLLLQSGLFLPIDRRCGAEKTGHHSTVVMEWKALKQLDRPVK